ncbi:hypothetical protein Pdw03_5305 [Penicillium digitatum]|uniref:Uncharacterized protein n=1 Tax=Penicillium digitatum TaxID=36651 RepID=A0A7T6XUJ5_PENDI|nr:hypothetical protein Pdw03_5305 [Penicillium digitatum]
MTAVSMRKIKMLAAGISVYFPDHPLVTRKRLGFFQTTFPRLCDFLERTFLELSITLKKDLRSESSVAWQLQDMLDSL